jgi:hypothetical protein
MLLPYIFYLQLGKKESLKSLSFALLLSLPLKPGKQLPFIVFFFQINDLNK